jgi:membrane protease YdiL (CAAX protease family)
MHRKAWLALGGLLAVWGFLLIGMSLVLSLLGIGGGVPATDSGSAFRLALGNSLALVFTFGLSALVFYPLWKDSLAQGILGLGSYPLAVWGWLALLMLGLQVVLPWLALDAQSFELPPPWKEWETRLENIEAQVEAMILSLLTHGSLAANLIFLAVVPAVIEELFFRGALQGILSRLMRPVWAIWITAFVFSTIHGQVYGFIPRVLLGALMGYLVLYSQSLSLAMWAHFLNNAYATIGGYVAIHFLGRPELIQSAYRPPIGVALVGAALAGAAGYQVYRLLRHRG